MCFVLRITLFNVWVRGVCAFTKTIKKSVQRTVKADGIQSGDST